MVRFRLSCSNANSSQIFACAFSEFILKEWLQQTISSIHMLLHTPGCYFTHPSTSAIVSRSLQLSQQVSCPQYYPNGEQYFLPEEKFFEMPPKLMKMHGTQVRE